MKKHFYFTLVLLLSTLTVSSFAETKKKAKSEVTEEIHSEHGTGRFGMGFATFGSSGAFPGNNSALSFWIDFNSKNSLQPFFGVTASDPFSFGVGAIYRYTLSGAQASGFHVGGGFNLGTDDNGALGNKFFCNIFPVVGLHFNLGSHVNNVALSFDGGPVFHVTPSPFAFRTLPVSALAGASIHYFF